jgi:hypothetical protein
VALIDFIGACILVFLNRLDSRTNDFLDTLNTDGNHANILGVSALPSMKELLEKEMEFVQCEAINKVQKLKRAPDIHCGLEVFHLFVLDLLGVSFHSPCYAVST